ncbi:MAG: hypothetical protein KC656_24760 [Myxococcales bacterium]|nr:hypothetical protein [Myxococcales bacterium]
MSDSRSPTPVLVVRFEGPPRPRAQLSPKTVARTLGRHLGLRSVTAHAREDGDRDATDVVLAAPELDLLTLREGWAGGLFAEHQGVRATQLVVYQAQRPAGRADLEASAKRVVALSRG